MPRFYGAALFVAKKVSVLRALVYCTGHCQPFTYFISEDIQTEEQIT
jgi:hypothetical protein